MTTQTLRGRWRMPKLGIGPQIVVLLLVLGLVGAMAIEPTRQLLEQRRRMRAASHDLQQLNESNRRLHRRIERLKDPDYVDQLARAQSGLVRPGEIPYVVMPPSRSSAGQAAKKSVPEAPAPEPPTFVESILHFIGVS